ncbi:unnamed protein product, partial [Rotaria socialis]
EIYFILVPDDESILTDGNRQDYNVGELISFASFDIPADTYVDDQKANTLVNDNIFDPFNLYSTSTSTESGAGHYPPVTNSSFHSDPFDLNRHLSQETNSSVNIFSSNLTNNNNFIALSQPQHISTR